MRIQLSDHFDYKKIILFTMPSVIMLIFTSVYGVVDGFFVSNFVGKTPFAALNLIMPYIMILGAFGFMFGTGGSALIAKTLGEGGEEEANRLFSLIVYVTIIVGIVTAIISFIFIRPVARFFGAEGQLLEEAVIYAEIIIAALPFFMLQVEFQSLFITAEKPKMGLWVTVISGVSNMVFDALFVAVFKWGIVGAALATALNQVIGGVIPLIYFGRRNDSLLRLTKPYFNGRALLKTCTNGSSELMSNISMSLIGMLYNFRLIKYAGENGIAAYGVLMYVNFVFVSAFIGFSTGIAPVVSYHYGAGNHSELKNLLKKSGVITGVLAVAMFLIAEIFAYPISYMFVGYDKELMDLTLRGFFIFSFSYLFSGFAIFGSAFFTALNDGLTSALISFLRTLLFQVVAVIVFPIFWGIDGVWLSVVVAEIMSVIMTVIFIGAKRKKYQY